MRVNMDSKDYIDGHITFTHINSIAVNSCSRLTRNVIHSGDFILHLSL